MTIILFLTVLIISIFVGLCLIFFKQLSKHFTILNFTKHFTALKLTMALTCLLSGVLIKFLILPLILDYFSINISDISKYFISGSLVGLVSLGLRGIIEEIFREHFPQTISMGCDGSYPSSSSQTDSTVLKMEGGRPSSSRPSSSGKPDYNPHNNWEIKKDPTDSVGYVLSPKTSWDKHSYSFEFSGFTVTNGFIYVSNAWNINSIYTHQGFLNTTRECRSYAKRCSDALFHHSTHKGHPNTALDMPQFDPRATQFIREFMIAKYKVQSTSQYSPYVWKDLQVFADNGRL